MAVKRACKARPIATSGQAMTTTKLTEVDPWSTLQTSSGLAAGRVTDTTRLVDEPANTSKIAGDG